MKHFIFSFIFLSGLFGNALAQVNDRYTKRIKRYRSTWESLIPSHTKIQYAGSMGLLSSGAGWDYGKRNQWETDILVGFVPKYSSGKAKLIFTLKQNYMPWNIRTNNNKFSFEPLACGMYVNTITGDEFWSSEPDRYPAGGYYPIPTKIRFHIFVGERITWKIPSALRRGAKSITFFYELSSCDFYIVSAIQNSYLTPKDYVKLSLGLKMQLF